MQGDAGIAAAVETPATCKRLVDDAGSPAALSTGGVGNTIG
jgi:hypothetical protein